MALTANQSSLGVADPRGTPPTQGESVFGDARGDPGSGESITVADAYRALAIRQLEGDIMSTGSCAQHIERIPKILSLILKSGNILSREEKIGYFYQAVDIASRYLGGTSSSQKYKHLLLEAYGKYIDTRYSDLPQYPRFMDDVYNTLLLEAKRRREARFRSIGEKNEHSKGGHSKPEEVLKKIESIIGPIRLIIVPQESGEAICHHRIDKAVGYSLLRASKHIRYTIADPFHKMRRYAILIDHGSIEGPNQVTDEEYSIINPLINSYINTMEDMFCRDQHANIESIEANERIRKHPEERYDYRDFLREAIGLASNKGESPPTEAYIDDIQQAIDICRLLTLSHGRNKNMRKLDIPQEIDTILGGQITRRVFDLVRSIILSRDETMNGLGYPSGFTRESIPIEARIYSIIRTYEAHCRGVCPEGTRNILEKGTNSGYLDAKTLEVFLTSLEQGKISKNLDIQKRSVTPHRRAHYERQIQSCGDIMHTLRDLERVYAQFRKTKNPAKQSAIHGTIGELKWELTQEVNIRKIVISTRHGSTKSDVGLGKTPGKPDESITQEGIQEVEEKGRWLQDLDILIATDIDITRDLQTAEIICKFVNNCTSNCLSCGGIKMESALGNPQKNIENGRNSGSYIERLIADTSAECRRLVRDIFLSPQDPMILWISHADRMKAIDALMRNAGNRDGVSATKESVGNNKSFVYLIEGGRVIKWNLFFSINHWKAEVAKVNSITQQIFGRVFYTEELRKVNLIGLHDLLLDYIDSMHEHSTQEKMRQFMHALDTDPLTAHFSQILRDTRKR